jgi:heterodisulfide reductase subunit D
MQNTGFEEAFAGRIDDMLDACTRCGACFMACPIAAPTGLADFDPKAVIDGVLDIVRMGTGPEASQKWAKACMLSGECIKACDYGVNPRFLLAVARVQMAKHANELPDRRKQGVQNFRKMAEDVGVLSRLQLSDEALERLGQKPTSRPAADELPDVVFYTGCNVLKAPHIALLCLDIMDELGVSYRMMGGPSHCCGVIQFRAGDLDTASRFSGNTIQKLSQSKTGQVLAWCPSCFVQFSENMLPTFKRATGEVPFEMTPFIRFLRGKLDGLRPSLRKRVPMRVALHKHPGVAGVVEAAEDLLRAVPGIEIVQLDVPAVGLQSVNLATLPGYKRELQRKELEAARAAGVDALVAVYHSDHRELCAHERDWPFRILNVLETVGESIGFRQADHYKHLKVMQDADAIVKDAADLIAQHSLDADTARRVVLEGLLGDQPLPLKGGASQSSGQVAPS